MKAVGIIAEYNPFHNGHAYQIQKAKELSHADCVIVAMSGNFVQRGAPALLDKYSRASMALSCGADLVFEIPTLFATASAEFFAAAGVALLDVLGCVDALSFGCETPDLPLLYALAKLLSNEPKDYQSLLSAYVRQGMSFPTAREKAVRSHLGADAANFLSSPNNILALEYVKALLSQNSRIRPLPILRRGSGYHDTDISAAYASASAIRNHLLAADDPQTLLSCVPKEAAALLFSPDRCFLSEQDFSAMLYYKLLCGQASGFANYADGSVELSNRICHEISNFTDYKGFVTLLKRKDVTYTRISRLLLHILLDIKTADYATAKDCGFVPYLRLLGFRKESASFLGKIKKHASLPLLTKPARHASLLTETASHMFCQDVFASDLYYGVLAQKSKMPQKNEYQRGICIIS